MKSSESDSNTSMYTLNEAAAEERRQKRIEASGRRAAAYDRLSFSDAERDAMEWACARRGISDLATLRPFYEEAESIADDGVAAWLDSGAFSGERAESLAAGVQNAIRHHERSQEKDRFAARAENATVWFLRLCVIILALIILGGMLMRGGSNNRVRTSFFRWYDNQGPANVEQQQFEFLTGQDFNQACVSGVFPAAPGAANV